MTQVGSWFYIYGVTLSQPYDSGLPQNVVLARATEANLTQIGNWEFLKWNYSWQPGHPTSPSDLWNVANAAGSYSTVDRITTTGPGGTFTQWLMVQSWWYFWRKIVLRRSDDAWQGAVWPNYGQCSDQLTMVKPIGEAAADPTCGPSSPAPVDVPCGDDAYHQTGQWAISDQVNKKLRISYYCTWVDHELGAGNEGVSAFDEDENGSACDPGAQYPYRRGCWALVNGFPHPSTCNGWIGRVRFYDQDLLKIRPWCTTNCETP